MREIALILRGNMRKSKSAFLGIAIMMLIASLSLTITLSIVVNTDKRDWELMKSCGLGNAVAALKWNGLSEHYEDYENRCEELAEELRDCQDVEKVELIPSVYLNIADVNGESSNSSCWVFSIENESIRYHIYDEQDNLQENFTLNADEIVVPNSFKALYNTQIGDEVVLEGLKPDGLEPSEQVYKIVAYMEDPYMGSSLMGIKSLLISEEALEQYGETGDLARGFVLSIFKESSSKLSDTEFETMLNQETGYGSQAWITFTYTMMNSYMTLLTNIFSGVLIVFVGMIVIATLIVLNHSISSSIELDFVNLGILKALGVTNGKLRAGIVLGYLLAAFCGAVLGIPLSIPLIGVINQLINPTIGLYGENAPCVLLCVEVLVVILTLFTLFIIIKLRKLKRISPVKAINSGREDVHFSSLLKLPICKTGFKTSLAYRQFSAEKKQYGAAILITAILVWVMVMITDMCAWFQDGGEKLDESFSTVSYDMITVSNNLTAEEELRAIIEKHDPEAERFIGSNRYILLEDSQVMCMICSEPERFQMYEGRTCLYENEIVITEFIVENYGVDIGDMVTINVDGTEKEFLITGYFICSNDAGKCIGMPYNAYDKMCKKVEVPEGEEAKVNSSYMYKLSNPDLAEEIVAEVDAYFEEEEASASVREGFGGMEMIIVGVWGLAVIIYGISGVFVAVTVVMMCTKIFAKEKQDYGVYKAMGFTAQNLRNMFSIRFAIIALIGSILGIVLAFLLSGAVVGVIFESFGLYHFESSISAVALVIPVVFAAIVYYVVAYITSRKMKKLSPSVLIRE